MKNEIPNPVEAPLLNTIKKSNNFFHEGKLTLYYINFSFARNDTINQLVDCSHEKLQKKAFLTCAKLLENCSLRFVYEVDYLNLKTASLRNLDKVDFECKKTTSFMTYFFVVLLKLYRHK